MIELRTENSGLKITSSSVFGFLLKVTALAVETEKDLMNVHETFQVLASPDKTLTVPFCMTEYFSCVRVECANLRVDLEKITALVQLVKIDVEKRFLQFSVIWWRRTDVGIVSGQKIQIYLVDS